MDQNEKKIISSNERVQRYYEAAMKLIEARGSMNREQKAALSKLAGDMKETIEKDENGPRIAALDHPLEPIKEMIGHWIKRYPASKRAGVLAIHLAEKNYDADWLKKHGFKPGLFNPRHLGRWIKGVIDAMDAEQRPANKQSNKPKTERTNPASNPEPIQEQKPEPVVTKSEPNTGVLTVEQMSEADLDRFIEQMSEEDRQTYERMTGSLETQNKFLNRMLRSKYSDFR